MPWLRPPEVAPRTTCRELAAYLLEVKVTVTKRKNETVVRNTVPSSESWLYKNKKALKSVKLGLKQAAKGKVTKLNLNEP